jgi:hypothetical protein
MGKQEKDDKRGGTIEGPDTDTRNGIGRSDGMSRRMGVRSTRIGGWGGMSSGWEGRSRRTGWEGRARKMEKNEQKGTSRRTEWEKWEAK